MSDGGYYIKVPRGWLEAFAEVKDPNEPIADNGGTVWNMFAYEAQRFLADNPWPEDPLLKPEYARCNEHAMHDYRTFPAIVRGFIAINQGPATETLAMREAGFWPKLFADYEGQRVRVTMVSRLGDVGISTDTKEEWTYQKRVSIYDLTNFSETP